MLAMKLVRSALAFTAATLLPAFALACPGAAAHGSCGGSALSQDMASLSFGVLVGVASVAAESVLRSRKG